MDNRLNFNFIFGIVFSLLVLMNPISVSFLFGQTSNEAACLELIQEIYKKRNSPPPSFNQNQVYYLDYQITTTFREEPQIPPHTTDVKVFMSQKQTRFLSEEMSVYQDESNTFNLMPDRKVIYRGDSTMDLDKEMRLKSVAGLQDKLFDLAEVSECKDIELPNGKANKQIVLQLDDQGRKVLPYEKVTFLVDTTELFIHKVILDYPKPNKIARIEITFNEISHNYKTDILDKPLMSIFFNEKGELLPEYKGFKLIDQRSRSRK